MERQSCAQVHSSEAMEDKRYKAPNLTARIFFRLNVLIGLYGYPEAMHQVRFKISSVGLLRRYRGSRR